MGDGKEGLTLEKLKRARETLNNAQPKDVSVWHACPVKRKYARATHIDENDRLMCNACLPFLRRIAEGG